MDVYVGIDPGDVSKFEGKVFTEKGRIQFKIEMEQFADVRFWNARGKLSRDTTNRCFFSAYNRHETYFSEYYQCNYNRQTSTRMLVHWSVSSYSK